MKNAKFSIIIPHKNSFELLLRLLESIPANDNFEIVVIDDCSDFFTQQQLKNYLFNPNVQIIYNKSIGGPGLARNIGLNLVTGAWILFADADDYFNSDIENILDKYYYSDADIVYFLTNSVESTSLNPSYRHIRYVNLVLEYLRKPGREDSLKYHFTPPWGKMFKKDLLVCNNIYFEEVPVSNDIMFSLKSAYKANSIFAVEDILYVITVSKGSLVNTFSKDNFNVRLNVAIRANNFLKSINKSKYQLSVLYYLVRSHKFGLVYMVKTFILLIQNKSNFLIGSKRVFKINEVLQDRENKLYINLKK